MSLRVMAVTSDRFELDSIPLMVDLENSEVKVSPKLTEMSGSFCRPELKLIDPLRDRLEGVSKRCKYLSGRSAADLAPHIF